LQDAMWQDTLCLAIYRAPPDRKSKNISKIQEQGFQN
jgi:hypothetical protein